ncbi:MAG: response regulator [Calditrichaeota bacterium]|nr:MAG: response regulator [Calditrichota bacterium]
METLYSRSNNIDELIRSVKLPYVAWKVLFLVTQNNSADEIKDILASEKDEIDGALALLVENSLLKAESAQAEVSEAPVAESVPEPEVVQQEAEQEAPEEENLFEEIVEDEPVAEAATPETEAPEITEMTDTPITEEELLVESDLTVEEETPGESGEAEEELVIDIPTEEQPDLSDDLNFDTELTDMAPPEPVAPAVEAPAAEPADTGDHKKILVIDDSLVIRKMVEIALEDEDYIIETAVSGKEGISKLDSVNPALVILDMMLPDINGIEILKTIKASKGIPVIMLSGKDSPQMVENAKKEGAEEFLPKPFKDDDLVEKVKALAK